MTDDRSIVRYLKTLRSFVQRLRQAIPAQEAITMETLLDADWKLTAGGLDPCWGLSD